MSVISAVETFQSGMFPNTAGTVDVEPETDFRVVTGEPITLDARFIQVNAFGFGGQDASLILGRYSA
jgi:3-oxoacyl-[acyl-carrier-protein] synthase II